MGALSSVEAMEVKQQHQNGTSLIFTSELVLVLLPKCVFWTTNKFTQEFIFLSFYTAYILRQVPTFTLRVTD